MAAAAAMVALSDREIAAWARRISYTLRVPGTHPSGLPYDALLEILAAQGRDFTADSLRLRAHIINVLREQFASSKRPPGMAQLRQFASAAILEWILARLEGQLRDVPIRSLDPEYRARKRAAGEYVAPGMRTGALRDRIRDHGVVRING